jgi:phosphatidylglycerophosphatase A
VRPDRAALLDPAVWIASGFGAGFAPIAPGTVGSAVALLPYLGLRLAGTEWVLVACATVFAIGVLVAQRVIDRLGTEDPGLVVIDEWVGQWLALAIIEYAVTALAPQLGTPSLAWVMAVGFVAFRICDVLKPWPANWADRALHGGFGAMLDDTIAGVWAGALGAAAFYGVVAIR